MRGDLKYTALIAALFALTVIGVSLLWLR